MNHEIKYPREYTEELRVLETTDRGHADTFNVPYKTLINNDAYLKEHTDQADGHRADPDIHVTAEQKSVWDRKAESTEASAEAAGLMSTADKAKLDGIEAGAEANQKAIGNIKVGNTVVQAGETSAQVELEAGPNISITGDNATKRVTIRGPEALQNPYALAIQANGITLASYNGSAAHTVNITPASIGAAGKSTIHQTTLPASGWTGSTAPYHNTISVPGATKDNIIEVVPPPDLTAEQVEAFQAAQILNGSQAAGSITANCWGDVPAIDLPVTVIVRGDVS